MQNFLKLGFLPELPRAIVVVGCVAVLGIGLIIVFNSHRSAETQEGQHCPEGEVFRASDSSCYSLQGE